MTKDEFKEAYRDYITRKQEIKDAFRVSIKSFEDKRDADLAEAALVYQKAVQTFVKEAPFSVGDIVSAKHMGGFSFPKSEKCKITHLWVDEWSGGYTYRGVKCKKDGSFGAQEATLRDVQPYTESGSQEAE